MTMTFMHDQQKFPRSSPSVLQPELGAKSGIMGRPAPLLAFAGDDNPTSQRSPRDVVAGQYFANLDVVLTEEDRAFWCFMSPARRPSFTRELLVDLARMQQLIGSLFAAAPRGAPAPFDYFILGSHAQGVFNLGGDLVQFAENIRRGEREELRRYAHACVTSGYANYTGYDQGLVTIALIQGDALGGGLEAALSCDMLVAERQAKFGLPEIVFNLFPGMGAYTYLSRRVGMLKAEQIIMSGRIYSAEEMHTLGVVDMLVKEGEGERAVREHIARNRSRHLAQSAIYKVRRRVNPVSLDELRDVTDLWVDTALRLSGQDLNKMCRIAAAQDRFRARQAEQKLASA
jgi:DSF synthase